MNRTRTIKLFTEEAKKSVENAFNESKQMLERPNEKYHLLNAEYYLGQYYTCLGLLNRFCVEAFSETYNAYNDKATKALNNIEIGYYGKKED